MQCSMVEAHPAFLRLSTLVGETVVGLGAAASGTVGVASSSSARFTGGEREAMAICALALRTSPSAYCAVASLSNSCKDTAHRASLRRLTCDGDGADRYWAERNEGPERQVCTTPRLAGWGDRIESKCRRRLLEVGPTSMSCRSWPCWACNSMIVLILRPLQCCVMRL